MSDAWDEEKQAKIKSEFNKQNEVELERTKNFFIGGSVALNMFAEELKELLKPVEAILIRMEASW